MQEIDSTGGGRFFGGGGGDRRLRPHHHHHQNHHHPALKCPRCDSLNTKFCYFNNYNLSQPRHFCKNCRRYWTKGGVLRNVPVGGGCRKSKRSNKPKNNSSSSSETATAAATTSTSQPPPEPDQRKSNSHSSSESSSLTAAAAAATEAMSAPTPNPAPSNNKLLENIHEPKFLYQSTNPSGLEMEQGGIFSEVGTFTSLITSTNEALAFGFGNINNNNNNNNNNNIPDHHGSAFRFSTQHGSDPPISVSGGGGHHGQCQWQQQKVMGFSSSDHHHHYQDFTAAGSLLDHTVPLEFSALQNKTGHGGGFGSLDWQAGADQGLFDLPNTVDQTYWTHTPHWSDQDNPTLFHLP